MRTHNEQIGIIQDVTQTPAPTHDDVVAEAIAAMGNGVFPVRIDTMLESLRYAEYDINSGVGELVDNAIEEGSPEIWVAVTAEPKKFKSKTTEVVGEIAVTDNGGGMSAEVLSKCLVLGESLRPKKAGGRRGIGRFGVGMTLGAISLGRRVEVYSRQKASGPFLFTYLDLDEVGKRTQQTIPTPIVAEAPKPYADLLKGSSGTIVVIRNCDRLQTNDVDQNKGIAASEQVKGLPIFLGRTYRKFIFAGRKIWFNGSQVYLHDPLYELGPTYFDAKGGKPEPRAKQWGNEVPIPMEVPGNPKETANVTIRMTLLPKEWRPVQGAGNWPATKERHIDDNQGISILRADREVLYGEVPYIIGPRGVSAFKEIDRWWGCEISFPPELDSYFHVRYIKRGAEPVAALRERIRLEIHKSVEALRKQIQDDYQKAKDAKEKEQGIYAEAEDAMARAANKLPKGKRGSDQTPEESEKQLNELVSEDVSTTAEEKEKKKAELKNKPFAIVPVNYPKNVFFETQHSPGRITVKLNVNHPFYKEVFEPLCGTVETMTEDSDINDGADTPTKQLARRGFLLLLLSYGKSESFFTDHEETLENLRAQWGITLATALKS